MSCRIRLYDVAYNTDVEIHSDLKLIDVVGVSVLMPNAQFTELSR
jgi:hypothetical protein